MLEEAASAIPSSLWASMNSWFTLTVLFLLLNLMIGTIAITSSFSGQKQPSSKSAIQNDFHPPNNFARSPSVLQRLKSVNFYANFRSHQPQESSSLHHKQNAEHDGGAHENGENDHQSEARTQTEYVFEERERESTDFEERERESTDFEDFQSACEEEQEEDDSGSEGSMDEVYHQQTCGICAGIAATGQGQAIITAECSHSFHFSCIGCFVSSGNRLCPVCHAPWNHLPLTMPISNASSNYNYTSSHPFFNRPSPYPAFGHVPLPQFPLHSVEPPIFCDDEPLPASTSDPAAPSSGVGLQKVAIKAVPERQAVAASEYVSLFSVLVGLKAPSLSDDARSSQRSSIDIVTVLDVSGSMMGRKLDLVKRAVHFVIDNLGVSDRLSVVSFSDQASRLMPLRRMTGDGRDDAKRAVDSLFARGGTNIVEGLRKGARVLGERRYRNPVTSVIFLSDGNDTYNSRSSSFSFQGTNPSNAPGYLHLLPASIYPENRGLAPGELVTIPVHSFGFGSDHDPITMHAISDASGGTFSFIESYEMVQDAFASCIGGLLSVVAQDLRLKVRSASHGVEIKLIPSGRYSSGISNQGSEGLINIGELYADEEKEFLINLSVPVFKENGEGEETERKTSLLDITCYYKHTVSKEVVQIESDLVEIRRPKCVSPQDMVISMEVDRQRNRLQAAESIQQAQQMAEAGNLTGARTFLAGKRTVLLATASAQAGDGLSKWLEAEMKETEMRMETTHMYQQSGRAFALSAVGSHARQRATTNGNIVAGASQAQSLTMAMGSGESAPAPAAFFGYATPNMASMVSKSQQQNKTGQDTIPKKAQSF